MTRKEEAAARFRELVESCEEPADGAFAAGTYPEDEDDKVRRALANFMRCAEECAQLLAEPPSAEENGVWDAFRKEGMAKIANAALREHGWMLVFDMAGDTIPMRLPGAPRIARAEDLEAEDVKHLDRLARLTINE